MARHILGPRIPGRHKFKCCICGNDFSDRWRNRITCGKDACQKKRASLVNGVTQFEFYHSAEGIAQRNKIYKSRVQTCPYCKKDFSYRAKRAWRSTCGDRACLIKYQTEFNKIVLDMYRELKTLAGI